MLPSNACTLKSIGNCHGAVGMFGRLSNNTTRKRGKLLKPSIILLHPFVMFHFHFYYRSLLSATAFSLSLKRPLFQISPSSYKLSFTSTILKTSFLSTKQNIDIDNGSVERSRPAPALKTAILPDLFPHFATILNNNGYVIPTPIQQTSSIRAKSEENLLLIASTGSGKTLAYLLPSLSRTFDETSNFSQRKTVLLVGPTRELAAQLARDASLLLSDNGNETMHANVLLAVRGIPPPTPNEIAHATVIAGTPNELYAVFTRISRAQNFLAGDTLSGVILDEVDVLLPSTPKTLRTSFDNADDSIRERKALEQRRKRRAAQRSGAEFHGGSSIKGHVSAKDQSSTLDGQVITPTERLLRLISSARFMGKQDDRIQLQLFAGSATASRSTLDRLNRALRWAGVEGGIVGMGTMWDSVWNGNVKVCRVELNIDEGFHEDLTGHYSKVILSPKESSHTIRAVTVPSVVDHRYVYMTKSGIGNSHEILGNVVKVIQKLHIKRSLVFLCGEFSRPMIKEKKKQMPKINGKTSEARRDAMKKRLIVQKRNELSDLTNSVGLPEPLSVRGACSILNAMGIEAKPMHVALGLEPNADDSVASEEIRNEKEVELPPILVTFEGSARGLHFDGIDAVFVVGRPKSVASYLHLAGRVGRATAEKGSERYEPNFIASKVHYLPGTIVSFCSKGRVAELEKWIPQIGGTELQEIVL